VNGLAQIESSVLNSSKETTAIAISTATVMTIHQKHVVNLLNVPVLAIT
jgi:hypothetical protein